MLINATTNQISLYREEDTDTIADRLVLKRGVVAPYRFIPASGLVLSGVVHVETRFEDGVMIKRFDYSLDPLPDGDEMYIVSQEYANGAPSDYRPRLLVADGEVYETSTASNPVGYSFLRALA